MSTDEKQPWTPPQGAVALQQPPLNKYARPCDFDGDIDHVGRFVIYKDGCWWGWHIKPNQPLLQEDTPS